MRGWRARPVAGVGRGRPVAGGSWPVASRRHQQPAHRPTASVDRSEATMSRLTRALILGATLAAMHLAGLTAVAHAQATRPGRQGRPTAGHPTPSRGDWRRAPGHRTAAGRRGCRPPAGAGPRALLHPQPDTRPADRPSAAQPSGQPNWLLASLGGFAVGLALAGGLADAGRQTGRPQSTGRARGLTYGHAARWGCRAHPAAPSAFPSTISC